MTDPAITRVAEFTKRLGETQRFYHSLGVYEYAYHQGSLATEALVAALHADLTHVLAELERLNPNMAGWTAEEVADIRAHHAASSRRDEEKEG